MSGTQRGTILALGGVVHKHDAESIAVRSPARFAEPWAKTILVAGDDPDVRELVSTLLQYRGYRVLRAADGAAGLEHLHQRPVDMLITDVDMPVLSGCELAGHARAMWPDLPILFISGSAANANLSPDPAPGLRGFLSKPFSFSALMSEVESLLQRRGAGVRPVLQVV